MLVAERRANPADEDYDYVDERTRVTITAGSQVTAIIGMVIDYNSPVLFPNLEIVMVQLSTTGIRSDDRRPRTLITVSTKTWIIRAKIYLGVKQAI
jgi:hypothetical protein